MFEYASVRLLVPSYDIGIWSHKWKKRVLIMTWLYFVYIQTLDNHPKVRQNSASMKSSIPRYTWQYEILILVYTELYKYGLVILSYTELYVCQDSRCSVAVTGRNLKLMNGLRLGKHRVAKQPECQCHWQCILQTRSCHGQSHATIISSRWHTTRRSESRASVRLGR